MHNRPFVSVLMPTLNQVCFINAAIDSVLGQDYPLIELIVADGGSTDGTLDVLKNRQATDARLRWFSQPDNGPAEAINNALSKSRGTIIGWLNSDDLYTEAAISRAVQALQLDSSLLMVYGLGQHVDAAGVYLSNYPTLPPETFIKQFAEGCFICQPTVFFRRTMPVLLGKLDEHLKTAFDFDYWLRAFSAFQNRIGFVNQVQAYSRLHDDCITLKMRRRVTLEGMQVLATYLGSAPKEWLLTYINEVLNTDEPILPDVRADIDQLLNETTVFLSTQDVLAVKAYINNHDRLRQNEFPEASNFFAPSWADKTFLSAVSLGSFCHAAEILKQTKLRMFSGPFDWLFTNPAVVTHCLADDFNTFLDRSNYQVIPLEERDVPAANCCDHMFYRDQFGIKYLFNHHNPTEAQVYEHFVRSVERFRQLRQLSPVLFLLVTQQSVLLDDYAHLINQVEVLVPEFLLVVVRFVTDSAINSKKEVTVTHHQPHFMSVDFYVTELSNGVVFSDAVDNLRFAAFIKSFKVSSGGFFDADKSVNFDEAAYLIVNPDVKMAIQNDQFKSGLDHYQKYGRNEGRPLCL